MANSVDPDQTAPIGAACSWSTLFASILNSSVMLGNYLQQTTSADGIFRCIFFLGDLRAKERSSESSLIYMYWVWLNMLNTFSQLKPLDNETRLFTFVDSAG